MKNNDYKAKLLFGIPVLLFSLWRIIQFQILGIPLPDWCEYVFFIYLCAGFLYFCWKGKSNDEEK